MHKYKYTNTQNTQIQIHFQPQLKPFSWISKYPSQYPDYKYPRLLSHISKKAGIERVIE